MTRQTPPTPSARPSAPADFYLLCVFALGVAAVHVATNGRYGLHRDELQFLDDARHFAFGYVAYPPVTPWLERIAFALAGPSLIGLRMFSVLAQAIVLVLTGLMARELGGGRFAQIVAVAAVAISPLELFDGTEFQYTSFDYFWWVLTAYLMIRLLRSGDARLWLGIGASIGLGMMTKYTMAFFVAGIVGGVLFTPARRYLKSPWLWCGAALAVLIFLPNLIWQIHHHFITLDFLRHVHARDVGEGRAAGFWRDQFLVSTNFFAVPLWIAGLIYVWARPEGKSYRVLGWMFAIPFALFVIDKGRGYYQAAAYPMLFAAGAVWEERWMASLSTGWRRAALAVTSVLLAVGGVASAEINLPIFPVNSPRNIAIKINGEFREEVGWREMVRTIANIRDTLPPVERNRVGILAANYGEAGAIDLYGPAYGLPAAISGVNSFWARGYGNPPPQTLIVLGFGSKFMQSNFESCRVAGRNTNRYGLDNEESREHPKIYVCGPPRDPWPAFWSNFQYYG